MLEDSEREQIEKNIAVLDSLDTAIEGWTSKIDGRQTGFSLYIKFTKKTDVMTSLKFANLMENSAPYSLALARKLVALDDELREAKRTIELISECYEGDLRNGGHIFVPGEVWQRVKAKTD